MSIRHESWPPGTPAWVDLMVPDLQRAREFYGELLGWEVPEGSPEFGNYTSALVGGEAVAGLGEGPPGGEGPPSQWTTYLAVESVDDACAGLKVNGGQVLMEPMTVGDFGRMAVAVDPAGAVFGMWQSGTHTGANRVNEPGGVVWNEVLTGDDDRARRFYAEVFGWSYDDMSGDGFTYATFSVPGGEQPGGGIGSLTADMSGPDSGPHWATYFAVADCDGTVARVAPLGGAVLKEPFDTEYGRAAMVRGPFGEVFCLMGVGGQPADQPTA
ncbi:VOC family protein [Thalassiella azotivora]